jgi:hypothetical protein
MTRFTHALLLLTLAIGLSACGADTPTTPTADETVVFTAALLPANEVPPIAGAEANGSANATLNMQLAKDEYGTITAATFDVSVTATGFPAGTALTAAHIHPGVAGTNGGILISLGLAAGEVTFPNGGGSFSKQGITLTTDQANAILANPGAFYLNIHTAANTGGVARGQLARTQ